MGVKVNCELVKKEMLIDGIYKFSVKAPEIAKVAKAGQFLEIKVTEDVEPLLRRPISIYNVDRENDIVEFIFPAVKTQSFNSLYALLSVKIPNLQLRTPSLKILSVQKSSNWQSEIVVALLLLTSELTIVFIRLIIVLLWILPFTVSVSI
jgi:hypothetical protein